MNNRNYVLVTTDSRSGRCKADGHNGDKLVFRNRKRHLITITAVYNKFKENNKYSCHGYIFYKNLIFIRFQSMSLDALYPRYARTSVRSD